MNPHIAFVGAGALGSFVGGLLTKAGHSVSLIDPWPEHVERIRREGLLLSGTDGIHRVGVKALHVTDVQSLVRPPVDIAFVCVKLYDTRWATALIAPYLARDGFVVTMQNGLVEEEIAQLVGWARVVGCIASRVQVELVAPGEARRTNPPGGASYTAFRVGETHGRVTPRATQVADLLRAVDSAKVTSNLWGERWSKLVANTMTSPVCAVSGLPFKAMYEHPGARRLIVRLAAEAIETGRALGFDLESVFGATPDDYLAAARGDEAVRAQLEEKLRAAQGTSLEGGRSGIAQDLGKGRRTEVEYFSGFVATRAAAAGIAAPLQARITRMVHDIERGALAAQVANIDRLLSGADF